MDNDVEEKEELIKKYVTMPSPKAKAAKASKIQKSRNGWTRGKMALLAFLVVAFFVGTGFGIFFMTAPSNNTSAAALTVNESAFPPSVTNVTNTTNKTKVSNRTSTNKTVTVIKKTTTPTTTTPTTPTNTSAVNGNTP